jgi:hypothetical protein
VIALILGTGATAWAVSDGHYRPGSQHCSGAANDSEDPTRVEPDCRNFIFSVSDGAGNESWFGFRQTADGDTVDPTNPDYHAASTLDPASGMHVYFGADDNLDNGEHDSSPLINNGASDGGAIVVNADPASVDPWMAAVSTANVAYLLTHPIPVLDAGFGACADGICAAITTLERIAYAGGDRSKPSQPVYDYSGKVWDPDSCGGPSDTAADCGGEDILAWHNKDGDRTTEPGVQVFEDPDPQGSPIGPYPLPALYAGTCGVVVGGGPLEIPDSPLTNSAHQLQISTGC